MPSHDKGDAHGGAILDREALRVYSRFWEYVAPYKRYLAVSIFGMILFAGCNTGIAMLMRPLLDDGVAGEGVVPKWIPFAVFAVMLARGVGNYLSTYYMGIAGEFGVRRLRTEIFAHMLRLPSSFYDAHDQGGMLSRLTQVTNNVKLLVSRSMVMLIRDILTLAFLLAWMIYLNWILATVFLLMGPLVLRIVRSNARRFRRLSHAAYERMGDLTGVVGQALRGEEVVKSFVAQDYMLGRFNKVNDALAEYNRGQLRVKSTGVPLAMFILGAGISVVIFLFTFEAVVEWMSIGTLVSFLVAAVMVPKPVRSLVGVNALVQSSLTGMRMVLEVMDAPVEPQGGASPASRENLRGDIAFENVSLRYAGAAHDSLSSVSLAIKAGHRLALVGRSGAGKSTLVRLLMRFYEPDSGRILVDGGDIRETDLHVLRGQIAYVSQKIMLFNDTIARNIACDELVDDARVREAARLAHVLEFADELPEGLDTRIGRGARTLSGGQSQRIALARCVYKAAPIIVFDEATSSLDAESEEQLRLALDNTLKGRTCIIIAHRFSTIRDVDAVAVMERGRIVQTGTHDELIKVDGVYKTLYNKGDAGMHA